MYLVLIHAHPRSDLMLPGSVGSWRAGGSAPAASTGPAPEAVAPVAAAPPPPKEEKAQVRILCTPFSHLSKCCVDLTTHHFIALLPTYLT